MEMKKRKNRTNVPSLKTLISRPNVNHPLTVMAHLTKEIQMMKRKKRTNVPTLKTLMPRPNVKHHLTMTFQNVEEAKAKFEAGL